MRIRSLVATIVIAAVTTVTVAPAARAADNPVTAPTAAPRVDFQHAIARAAAQHAATPEIGVVAVERPNQAAMQGGYPGGGGSHIAMVMSIVGMVAGIGMTYYVIKATQKTLKNSQQQGQ